LTALYELLGVEPNPIPLKWCLQGLGIGSADLRLPLLPLSSAYHQQARQVLQQLNLSAAVQPRHSSAA
jgi:4-hydroxy-tetrahydrodipicolinate synthase